MARAAGIVVLLVVILGCAPCGPGQPVPRKHPVLTNAKIERFDPPPVYRVAWAAMEACSGLRGDRIEQWKFYVVRAQDFGIDADRPGPYVGLASRSVRSIYLAEPNVMDPLTVQHEMLHALGAWDEASPLFATCGVM